VKKALLGKKIGMTTIFDENTNAIPVTVILSGNNYVVQKKTVDTDGYDAIQVGFDDKKAKLAKKTEQGHFAKAGVPVKKFVKEFRLEDISGYEPGQELTVDTFAAGDRIDVVGISKGKGFAGAIKRYHFNRGAMGHGSMYHRRPGSGGATAPARVLKGSRMPGHMGHVQVTVQNLEIVKVIAEHNLILVKGAIPGPRKGYVVLKNTCKNK